MTFLRPSSPFARRVAASLRVLTLACTVGGIAAASAQNSREITSSTFDASRAELTHRLDSLQRVGSAGKPKVRKERDTEIAALKARLTDGDFQVGDRFLIDYGTVNRAPDTVLVRDSSSIALLNWPKISLQGVLHTELQDKIEKYVGTFVREPRLRVYPLTRLSIIGGIGRPGFYAVDPKRSLTDALMAAGGVGQVGKVDKITIYRGETKIFNEKRVAQAIEQGQTIEDLKLRSGDQVRIEQQKQGRDWRMTLQPVLLGVSVFTALLAIIRASYAP